MHLLVALCKNITAAQVVGRVHSSTHGQDEQILCSVGGNRWDFIFLAVAQIISAFIPCWLKFHKFVLNFSIMNEWFNKLHRISTDLLEKLHVLAK